MCTHCHSGQPTSAQLPFAPHSVRFGSAVVTYGSTTHNPKLDGRSRAPPGAGERTTLALPPNVIVVVVAV